MSDNRKRILAEVLSLDAWHTPFRIDGTSSAVHVEVSFQQGRLGVHDPELPFTFRISLKRALLTVKLEDPLTIKRSSVARDIPENPAEMSKILTAKDAAKRNSTSKGELSLNKFGLGFSGSRSTDHEISREDQLKIVQAVPRIIASARPRSNTEYAWELQPAYEQVLEGQPWNPQQFPRMQVRHPEKRSAIDPTIKVTLSCALEDVVIDELEPKSLKFTDQVREIFENRHSLAAAIQYLKLTLLRADLEVGNIDNRFDDLLIADVFSAEEMP